MAKTWGGGPGGAWWRGDLASSLIDDRQHHRVDIPHHIARIEPDDGHPLRAQPRIAACVPLRVVAHIMAVAVDLDHELGRCTEEVHRASLKRVLPSEFEPCRTKSQLLPQTILRWR